MTTTAETDTSIDFEKVEELKEAFRKAFAPGNRRYRAASDVLNERDRQEAKFGPLHYPDGTGRPGDDETVKRLKAACKANTPAEDNWRDILAEEVAEAFAETDRSKLRTELVQVAAVAQAWVEDIDRDGEL